MRTLLLNPRLINTIVKTSSRFKLFKRSASINVHSFDFHDCLFNQRWLGMMDKFKGVTRSNSEVSEYQRYW